ncbi:hypothetical protein [Dyadobacter sp. 3J3]|uniref:hypothetical protein n=1 Tax=Dyadobacter sp. 3J3 TaxID=2606600 RepID=UPI001357F001|nr:hypothetical protein [Dyadobacter sp. 3J3]
MSKISKEQMVRLKGQFSAKYGIEMDDWSAMVMTEISQQFMLFAGQMNASISSIEEASENIKGKVSQINFRNNQEALRFGLGLSIPFAAMGTIISVMVLWYSTTTREYTVRKQIIEDYQNAPIYARLMQYGQVVEHGEQLCLALTLADLESGNILIGKEYVKDGKSGQILIPLGRK